MAKDYDTDAIFDSAKELTKTARRLSGGDPQAAKMALEAAAGQIEREIMAAAPPPRRKHFLTH